AVIETRTPIALQHFTLRPGAVVHAELPPEYRGFAYVFAGEALIGTPARRVADGNAALFGEGPGALALSVPLDWQEPAQVLVVGGGRWREPVARYGPFVMSTRDELIEAFEDFQSGKLGSIKARVS